MKKCLIVDDDITTRFILKAMLEEFFACDLAESGKAAVRAFDQAHVQQQHYNLICLDISMPDMSGLQVLQHIRTVEQTLSTNPDLETKVVMITADTTPATILDSFFVRMASAYITKPIDRQKLLVALTDLALI